MVMDVPPGIRPVVAMSLCGERMHRWRLSNQGFPYALDAVDGISAQDLCRFCAPTRARTWDLRIKSP